jgi:hypothetical protein
MLPPTIFLSRLIGLSALLLSIALAASRPVTIDTIAMMMHDRPLLVVFAIIELVAGLALVLRHNIWSGLPAVVVTLVGWLLIIRSMVILLLPPDALFGLFGLLNFRQFYFLYVVILFVLGLYLTISGFRRTRIAA